jgi:hypothetical protein
MMPNDALAALESGASWYTYIRAECVLCDLTAKGEDEKGRRVSAKHDNKRQAMAAEETADR